jgi:hypothetical protein
MFSLENSRFTPHVNQNAGGSTFLGYLYFECIVEGALPDGGDLAIGMPDIQVRITVDGDNRIDFPEKEVTIKGEQKRVAHYFSSNKETRRALTAAVFELPAVVRAVKQGEVLRNAA